MHLNGKFITWLHAVGRRGSTTAHPHRQPPRRDWEADASGPRALIRNGVFATLSAGSAVFPLALLLIAGRVLGESEFGKFSFALALATIFENFIDFGLGQIAIRGIARDHQAARSIVSNTLGLKLVLSVVTMLALTGVVSLLREESDVRLACSLMGLSSVLRSYGLTVRQVLMGLERFGLESVVVIGDRLLLLVFGAAALVGGYGVVGLAAGFVAARVVAAGLAYALCASQIGAVRPRFDVVEWRVLQTRALPFGAFAIVLYLYNYIDMVMLGVMRSDAETGLYSAGYRIYEGVSSVAAILYSVLLPRLSHQFEAEPSRHHRLARLGLVTAGLLSVPVTAGTMVLAPIAVEVLFGQAYGASAAVVRLLALGAPFAFLLHVLHAIAISSNAERLSLRTAVIGCLANVLLNLVLIPAFGINGAAAATVIGEAISFVVLLLSLRRIALSSARSLHP